MTPLAALQMDKTLKEAIIKAAGSVREKYRALKRGQAMEDSEAKRRFEPLLEPLNKIVDLANKKKDEQEMEEHEIAKPHHSKKPLGLKVKRKGIRIRSKKWSVKKETPHRPSEVSEDDVSDHEISQFSEAPDVYESPGDNKARMDFQEYLKQFGPLTQEYVMKNFTDPEVKFDRTFGVRPNLKNDTWWIGNKEIVFDNQDFIHIGETMIPGSRGLFELLFKKLPNPNFFNQNDKAKYKRILELSSAHKQGFNAEAPIASSHGIKYNSIIKKLFPRATGRGFLPVTNNKIDYTYWNDANELVERLALLIASESAGNTGHRAEIAAIEEELREADYIE